MFWFVFILVMTHRSVRKRKARLARGHGPGHKVTLLNSLSLDEIHKSVLQNSTMYFNFRHLCHTLIECIIVILV